MEKKNSNSKNKNAEKTLSTMEPLSLSTLDNDHHSSLKNERSHSKRDHARPKNDSDLDSESTGEGSALHRPPGTRTKIIHLIYENKITHSARQKKIWIAKIVLLTGLIFAAFVTLVSLGSGVSEVFSQKSISAGFSKWWDQMGSPVPRPKLSTPPKQPVNQPINSLGQQGTSAMRGRAELPATSEKATSRKEVPVINLPTGGSDPQRATQRKKTNPAEKQISSSSKAAAAKANAGQTAKKVQPSQSTLKKQTSSVPQENPSLPQAKPEKKKPYSRP